MENKWIPINKSYPDEGKLIWVYAKREGPMVVKTHGSYFVSCVKGDILYPEDLLAWKHLDDPGPYKPESRAGEIAFRIRETVYKAMPRNRMAEEWGFSADEFEAALGVMMGGAHGAHDRGTKTETEGTPETV